MALIAWYKFEDDLTDFTNGYDLTPSGTLTYETGQTGKAINVSSGLFTSSTDLPGAIDGLASVTFDMYLKPSTLSFSNGLGCVFRDGNGSGSNFMYIDNQGRPWGVVSGIKNVGNAYCSLDMSINTDKFYRVTLALDGAQEKIRIWIDGVESQNVDNQGWAGPVDFETGSGMAFIRDSYSQYLNGLVDELKIYDEVVPPTTPSTDHLDVIISPRIIAE